MANVNGNKDNNDRIKLIYMYSAKKRDVEHIRVTLTSKFSFDTTVEVDDKGKLKKLTIQAIENKNYVENFFSENDRVDVTGIIGKNGIGKSAILDELYAYFGVYTDPKLGYNFIAHNDDYLKVFIVEEFTNVKKYKVYVNIESLKHKVEVLGLNPKPTFPTFPNNGQDENKVTRILYNNEIIDNTYNYELYGNLNSTFKIMLNDAILDKCTKEIIGSEIYKKVTMNSFKFIPEDKLLNRYRNLTYDILDNLFTLNARINLINNKDHVNSINFKTFFPDDNKMAISTFTFEEIEDELFEPERYLDIEHATDREYMFLIYLICVHETQILNIHEKYINIINMIIVDSFILIPKKFEKNDIKIFISEFVSELVEIIKIKDFNTCIEALNCLPSKILIYVTNKIIFAEILNEYIDYEIDYGLDSGQIKPKCILDIENKYNELDGIIVKGKTVEAIYGEINNILEEVNILVGRINIPKDLVDIIGTKYSGAKIKTIFLEILEYFQFNFNKLWLYVQRCKYNKVTEVNTKVFQFIKMLDEISLKNQYELDNSYWTFKYGDTKTLKKIFKMLDKNKYLLRFFKINHKFNSENEYVKYPFSSGEMHIIKLISRTNYFVSKLNPKNQKLILLLLDEPDNALHPEWQRLFFSTVIPMLENIAENQKKYIHVIFTSHSPMMISDIPRCNLNILDEHSFDTGLVTTENNDFKMNTLGANIFDLYKNSFFISKPIGEFALNKINKFYEDYNLITYIYKDKKELLEEEKNKIIERFDKLKQYKNIIELVGEPVLKNDMTYKYNEISKKVSLLEDNVEDNSELEKLKNELARLEEDPKVFKKVIGTLKKEIKRLEEREVHTND